MPVKHKGKTIQQTLRDLKKFYNRLPSEVGQMAVGYFRHQFTKGVEGYMEGEGRVNKWQKRKPKAKRNSGRAILTDTGRLKNSIKIVRKTQTTVVVGVPRNVVPYAEVHNTGGTVIARNGKPWTMPKRQFIAPANVGLSTRIQRHNIRELYKVFNK